MSKKAIIAIFSFLYLLSLVFLAFAVYGLYILDLTTGEFVSIVGFDVLFIGLISWAWKIEVLS